MSLTRSTRLVTHRPLERGQGLSVTKWGARKGKRVANWRDDFVITVDNEREVAEYMAAGAKGKTPYERALAAFVRTLPCCVCGRLPNVSALNEASHVALSADQKGMGAKVPHRQVVPKCHAHHVEWEERKGFCRGWTRDERYAQVALWLREVEQAVTPEDRASADELERWSLGKVIGDGTPHGFSWLPGHLTEVDLDALAAECRP